ncbi:hypothetical protein SDRG_05492 [Saprolegnia diclina VS20]|uniref:HTH TFE/IIEalpha-type domain-containing protein n=1 Tax=Saprolegnia diclina (strain VS20) TaxID=1156394 RepID=T0RXB5_SAPDV|nr:hypothetical protein SDRG_05492 [Saprolegnia diclina VS20]EQC37268.1 hypothetical protein SDRG_05492 [Saprolegnia diclina VS20]|eukprot:XP_008609430.1 hypothetical protein SDRG_05492 [Saprolegnia diclina VS20]
MAALVEKLVRLIARAFYSDEHIVVLEALLRERFLKDDEMGNAVNLQTKQVRKICHDLEKEDMISREELNDKKLGGASKATYWYIDYKHFVNVVRYRLYIIAHHLKESEQLEIERQTFRCSNDDCGREYTALEAQLLLTPDVYEFHCGHCNFKLVECDNNEKLQTIKGLLAKFKVQLNRQEDMHDGIYECLARISEWQNSGQALPSNLPSENRAAGIGGASTAKMNGRNGGGGGGGGGGPGGNRGGDEKTSGLYGKFEDAKIVIDIAENANQDEYSTLNPNKPKEEIKLQTANSGPAMPEFIMGSKMSDNMAAKYKKNAIPEVLATSASAASLNAGVSMGLSSREAEMREEAFREAYKREMERYNEINAAEVVWDSVSGNKWVDAASKEDEDLEDMEWEWCDSTQDDTYDEEQQSVMVSVNGCPTPIVKLTDDDLTRMTPDEYAAFYQLCRSMMV